MLQNRLKKLLLLAILIVLMPSVVAAVDCFQCHDPAGFKGRVVHAPVAELNCLDCHGPHVSRHPKLLLDREQDLCFRCHDQATVGVSEKTVLHTPLKDGNCSACHNPHAAEQDNLLKGAGGELCFGCHEASRKTYKVAHAPFLKGNCIGCHAPHGGEDARLLKNSGSDLCFSCHENSKPLRSKHLGRDMAAVDCLSCHHPHGGESASLLRKVSHAPFADRECQSCHADETGLDACLKCHDDVLSGFNYAHNHLGIAGSKNPCVSCHNPHVADRPGLLPENVGSVCRDCHADTFARREKSLHKHGNWETCTDCHDLHGSNDVAMLKQGSQVCHLCHDQHKGFTHPIGEKALDPRNNKPMDCLTCHNANDGTNYRYYLRGSGERGLCIQCHQSY